MPNMNTVEPAKWCWATKREEWRRAIRKLHPRETLQRGAQPKQGKVQRKMWRVERFVYASSDTQHADKFSKITKETPKYVSQTYKCSDDARIFYQCQWWTCLKIPEQCYKNGVIHLGERFGWIHKLHELVSSNSEDSLLPGLGDRVWISWGRGLKYCQLECKHPATEMDWDCYVPSRTPLLTSWAKTT